MNKNIAFFVISTELGGAEKSLLDFLKVFKDQHKSFVVITPKESGPLIDQLKEFNISTNCIPLPSFFLSLSRKNLAKSFLLFIPAFFYSFIYLFKVHRFIHHEKINSVHSTGLKYHLLLGGLSFFNKDSTFHIHLRDIINLRTIKTLLIFFSRQKNIQFIFNSKATAQALPQIPPKVIYNGFDPHLFSPGTSPLKKSLGLTEEQLLIGIVGVIARWKGQREFLQMAKKISENFKNLHFVIVGDEIYDTFAEEGELALLKTMSSELNLSSQVHFMGFQRNIENIYRGLDLLVHCSVEPEPFGRVIVEAMLCACPVVAANQGGPIEIIENSSSGLLYEQGNLHQLTQTVALALKDDQLRLRLSQAGRVRAESFSIQSYSRLLSEQILQR